MEAVRLAEIRRIAEGPLGPNPTVARQHILELLAAIDPAEPDKALAATLRARFGDRDDLRAFAERLIKELETHA